MRSHIGRYPAPGHCFCVDATAGADTNSGNAAAPLQTIAKVNALALKPGDRVLFKRGETWAETLTITWSGITIADYAAGALPILHPAAGTTCFASAGTHNVTVRNIECDAAHVDEGAQLLNVSNWIVDGCIFHHSKTYDGLLVTGLAATCYRVFILNCTAYNNAMYGGISVSCTTDNSLLGPSHIVVRGCTAYANGVDTARDHGIYVRCTLGPVWVQDCVSYSNSSCGFKARDVHNVITERCTSYSNNYGFGIDNSGTHDTVGNTWRNNLTYSNTLYGMFVALSTTAGQTNYVYHNTFAANTSYELNFDSAAVGPVFKNNIFYASSATNRCVRSGGASLAGVIFNYNCYKVAAGSTIAQTAGGTQNWAQWQALDFEANGVNANPVFVTNFSDLHLQTTSPAKAAGDATVGVLADKDSVVRGAQVDIRGYRASDHLLRAGSRHNWHAGAVEGYDQSAYRDQHRPERVGGDDSRRSDVGGFARYADHHRDRLLEGHLHRLDCRFLCRGRVYDLDRT